MSQTQLESQLLKIARNAFETACTLKEDQRLEVYLLDGKIETSDVMEESDAILYGPNRILCYQVYGHNFLEDEIKTWIDYARVITQPTDEKPLAEPTDIEKSVRELASELAKSKGVDSQSISSYEIFANLSMTLLGSIEQQIIEYWWSAKEDENAKILAKKQISEALSHISA